MSRPEHFPSHQSASASASVWTHCGPAQGAPSGRSQRRSFAGISLGLEPLTLCRRAEGRRFDSPNVANSPSRGSERRPPPQASWRSAETFCSRPPVSSPGAGRAPSTGTSKRGLALCRRDLSAGHSHGIPALSRGVRRDRFVAKAVTLAGGRWRDRFPREQSRCERQSTRLLVVHRDSHADAGERFRLHGKQ
jgi:hypothetical protein